MTTFDENDVGGSGYSLAELSEYLDRGRTPRIAAIERNAACRAALDRLADYARLSRELVAADADAPPPGWVDALFSGAGLSAALLSDIAREARAGRDIALAPRTPTERLVITEGALRGALRTAGGGVPGAIIGRVRFGGELEPGTAVDVHLTVSARYGEPLLPLGDAVRTAVTQALPRLAPLRAARVDVEIVDIETITGGAQHD